jgi:hypothetical protein
MSIKHKTTNYYTTIPKVLRMAKTQTGMSVFVDVENVRESSYSSIEINMMYLTTMRVTTDDPVHPHSHILIVGHCVYSAPADDFLSHVCDADKEAVAVLDAATSECVEGDGAWVYIPRVGFKRLFYNREHVPDYYLIKPATDLIYK